MLVEGSNERPEVVTIASEAVFKTYEQICLDKLKEIGKSTAEKWSFAMGYQHRSSLSKVIRRIKQKYPNKLKIYESKYPRLYEAI
ncbi:MAG: hypothetical protein EAX89_03890 [Candidatus Lokiarchaeota archaeon]|nr:hypothetical protein [Candidatus Lokiarchaeota archaeon]